MNEEKKNDLLLNVLVNPTFTMSDLSTVGITADNSTVKDYDEYKSNELVQQAFKTENGNFNEKEFKGFYDNVLSMYNVMATQEQEQDFSNYVSFHRDNFFAPDEQRRDDFDSEFIKASNPYQITSSIAELGKPGKRTKSIDEIAQAEKVLANPVEVENGAAPIYHDSPNDSFFTDFFDTRVLAQWDEDGTHQDPISGETIEHKKGDLKLNDNGTFYYENLDGRSIYGRRVLSKLNTLTVDGSDWNKYDFFDSDNLEENGVGKTLLKNAALVGTMFIPYVGPAVAGLSVATQAVGLFGTLGKILVGSDSPTLSAMEGWSKSLNRQLAKSEYAQENTWCLENWINLIGDVAAQLKEQRFLFEKAPVIFKGIGGASESRQIKKAADIEKAYKVAAEKRFQDLTKTRTFIDQFSADKARNELLAVAAVNAERDMNTFLKGYQKVGEVLSKAYMNGITTLDTYGEAKEAGATDLEAAMVAIGYAAQEAAILNTGIGEWILPELRADKFKNKALIKAITQDTKDAGDNLVQRSIKKLPNEGKKQYIYRLFNIGKKIAKAEYANGTPAIKATLAGGLGEGIEEVVEELSADFTRSCYNAVKWLQGDNEHRMNAWENTKDRYLMSFFGGMVGGTFTNAFTSYQGMRYMKAMDYDTAMQELVNICRDPKQISEFRRTLDKMDFDGLQIGNKRLTFETETDEDNNIIYKPGDKKNNQTIDIKKAVNKQLDLIVDTLNAEGAAIDDDSFLDQSALKDLRFYALRKATTAGMYLQQFNTACTNLSKAAELLNDFRHSHEPETDAKKAEEKKKGPDIIEENQLKKLTEDYEKAQKEVQDFVSGKHAAKYIQDALFEMNTALSGQLTTPILPLYAEKLYGKKYSELTESEINDATQKFKDWKNGEGKQKIHDVATQFVDVLRETSGILSTQAEAYKEQANNETVGGLTQLIHELYSMSNMPVELGEDIWMENAQGAIGSEQNYIKEFLTEQGGSGYEIGLLNTLSDEINSTNEEIASLDDSDPMIPVLQNKLKKQEEDYKEIQERIFEKNFDSIISKFTSQEFLHPEVKSALNTFLTKMYKSINKKLERLVTSGASLSETEDEDALINELQDLQEKITDAQTAIQNIANSPISESLKQFSIALTGQYTDVLKLINSAYSAMNNADHNLREVQFDPTMRDAFDNALELLKMYRAAISGSRMDNADILNIYGYSKALNDINHAQKTEDWVDLAEIDKDIADVFINDVDALIAKVQFAKTLMDINEGQKLQEQDKVSMNLHRLNFKGVKTFVQILDDDDDDIKRNVHFQELKDLLENKSNALENLLESGVTSTPSKEEQITITKQSLKIEDKLYDLFNSLSEDELSRIIKPQKLGLYNQDTFLLTANLDEVDPIAFVTYLMRCAAVKSSKLHKMYLNTRKAINSKYAPITTQEANILNQAAFVINGDMYTKFESAIKKAVIKEWASLSESDKRTLWNPGRAVDLLKPENDKYIMNALGFFRYKNFVLNEGGPGTGKTSACDSMVIAMINKYYPDLLKDAIVCHGADIYDDSDSAKSVEKSKKLAEDCGVVSDNIMNKKQLMKYIAPDYKIYATNEDGTIDIKGEDIELDDENELRAKFNVSAITDPPKIIIIDEISQFNSCELDLLQKFAERHGISIIISGDLNQSQVSGKFDVELNSAIYTWRSEIERRNFCHSYKMGLSMRTRNNLKNQNGSQLLALQKTNSGDVEFKYYYSNEEGLIGDYIQQMNPTTQDHEYIDSMFSKLADGEKVGYIYNDTNTDMYNYLTTNYADKIQMYPGTSAQGSEGKYYIVDFNTNKIGRSGENILPFLKNLYTAQTRSEVATILNFTDNTGSTIAPDLLNINLKCKQESSYQLEKLSEKAIENYTIKKESILTTALADVNDDVEYKPRTIVAPPTPGGSSGTLGGGGGPAPGSSPSPRGGLGRVSGHSRGSGRGGPSPSGGGGGPTPRGGGSGPTPGGGGGPTPRGGGSGPTPGGGGGPTPRGGGSGPTPGGGGGSGSSKWSTAEMAAAKTAKLEELRIRGYMPGGKFYMEVSPGSIKEHSLIDVVTKATKEIEVKYSDSTHEHTMAYDDFYKKITNGDIKLTPPPAGVSEFDNFKNGVLKGLQYRTADNVITILNFDKDADVITYLDDEDGEVSKTSFRQLFDILNNNNYAKDEIDSFVKNFDANVAEFLNDLEARPVIEFEAYGEEIILNLLPWTDNDGTLKHIAKIKDDGTLGIRFGVDVHNQYNDAEICMAISPKGEWKMLTSNNPLTELSKTPTRELDEFIQVLEDTFGDIQLYNWINPDAFGEVIDMTRDENKTAGDKAGNITDYESNVLGYFQDTLNYLVDQKRDLERSIDDIDLDDFDSSFEDEPPIDSDGPASDEELHFVDFDDLENLKGLMFSFNTFETGTVWNADGTIDTYKSDFEHNCKRIDSINGIAKLAAHWCGYDNFNTNKEVFEKFRSLFTREDAIELIAPFRAAFLSITNNDDLINKSLKNTCLKIITFVKDKILADNPEIGGNFIKLNDALAEEEIKKLFVCHAIKTRYVGFDEEDGNTLSDQSRYPGYGIFNRHKDEVLEFNQDNIIQPSPNQIVSFIGIKSTNDKGKDNSQLYLELPMLGFNNPFSLIQSEEFNTIFKNDPLIDDIASIITDKGKSIHIKSVSIQDKLLKKLENYKSKPDFTEERENAIKRILESFIFFDHTDNDIAFLKKDTNLASLGNPLSNTRSTYRGSTALRPDLKYLAADKKDAITVAKALSNPMCIKSRMLMLKKGIGDIKPGMPFVLYTFNPKYSMSELPKIFEEQSENPDSRKDVFYAYIYTPFYSVEEYCENLHNIIKKSPIKFRIGSKFSSYKILRDAIIGTDGNVNETKFKELEKFIDESNIQEYNKTARAWRTATSEVDNTSHGLAHTILNAIKYTVKNGYDQEGLKTFKIKISQKSNPTWIETEKYLLALCNDLLHHIAYDKDTINTSRLNDFKKLLGHGYEVRSVAKFKRQEHGIDTGDFIEIVQGIDENFMPTYKLNGKDCTVYGKLDTPAFNVNLTAFYKLFFRAINSGNKKNSYKDILGYISENHPFFWTNSVANPKSKNKTEPLSDEDFKNKFVEFFLANDENLFNNEILLSKGKRLSENYIIQLQMNAFISQFKYCTEQLKTLEGIKIKWPIIPSKAKTWNAIFSQSKAQYQTIEFHDIDFDFKKTIKSEENEIPHGREFVFTDEDKNVLTITVTRNSQTGGLELSRSIEKHKSPEGNGESNTPDVTNVSIHLDKVAENIINYIYIEDDDLELYLPFAGQYIKDVLAKIKANENISFENLTMKQKIELKQFKKTCDSFLKKVSKEDFNPSNLNIKSEIGTLAGEIKGTGNLQIIADQLKSFADKLSQEKENRTKACSIMIII